ncbi:MAG: hypothetical protein H6594_06935 [Flavobacteriales bacterium]|nr:hypothetical protein [Flavobacteriales bacterium]
MNCARSILFALCAALVTPFQAQPTMSDVVNGRAKLTWIGIDYSHVKLSPRYAFAEFERTGPAYPVRWNHLIVSEPEKYNLCEALKAADCTNDIGPMGPITNAFEVSRSFEGEPIRMDEVPGIVDAYATDDLTGVGAVFIAREYHKVENDERAVYFVSFFDMATKQVLHTEEIIGKPGGFGFRNYWAASVYSVIEQIRSTYLKQWKKRFTN